MSVNDHHSNHEIYCDTHANIMHGKTYFSKSIHQICKIQLLSNWSWRHSWSSGAAYHKISSDKRNWYKLPESWPGLWIVCCWDACSSLCWPMLQLSCEDSCFTVGLSLVSEAGRTRGAHRQPSLLTRSLAQLLSIHLGWVFLFCLMLRCIKKLFSRLSIWRFSQGRMWCFFSPSQNKWHKKLALKMTMCPKTWMSFYNFIIRHTCRTHGQLAVFLPCPLCKWLQFDTWPPFLYFLRSQ